MLLQWVALAKEYTYMPLTQMYLSWLYAGDHNWGFNPSLSWELVNDEDRWNYSGHIQGKGKLSCFKVFLKACGDVISALAGLGIGKIPPQTVLSGCLKFICQLFNDSFTTAGALRWHMFRQLKINQGIEKLPPTEGVMIEHILRPHPTYGCRT